MLNMFYFTNYSSNTSAPISMVFSNPDPESDEGIFGSSITSKSKLIGFNPSSSMLFVSFSN